MKRILAIFALVLLVASPSFALSDAEYLKFKKNAKFYQADKKLTQVWNELKKSMPAKNFAELQKNQRTWIKSGRDQDARVYLKKGYSKVEAYTQATLDRVEALPEIASDIRESYSTSSKPATTKKKMPARKTVKKTEPESYEVDDDEMEPQPLTGDDEEDDGDYGEIEEDRFKNSTGPEGNYSRINSGKHGGFMTVLIIDKEEMEAEITMSFQNPEATWSATGWIDDNVMEASDKEYSDCQATFTFSDGQVKVETTEAEGWDTILGPGNRLDGIYVRN